uniref:3-ketoacyl-CoA synthase n=1 Tax=Pseudo-nitzschia australis TaxID=44445 RepID=A0A7S4AAA6_9STRA|mmetsp:Transcript_19840/g.43060  ORF Transcript_19840/g.43060 Transcript_19840/m.43060 type:complete len:559 (-) Transcript_19840:163-1839(-)|eukprot:CAMPEP_0168185380 /NCGR_PEP_ID=MMETSP0139_2-20121125/13812_1 /TAXON_ID=44445 /ORGANISM="Pseudo-nitzschia australis, Strain 10249 10 AB" /LENGTH=558 /DNA_ID=CAMNT_0008107205 /DNA_START=152 /DNA_END=1828 /DNA_ORIENTATION=-
MPPRAATEGGVGELPSKPIKRVGSMGDISVSGKDEKVSNDYTTRKSTLIGMINWVHVLSTDAPAIFIFGLVILVGQVVYDVVMDLFPSNEGANMSLETVTVVFAAIKQLFVRLYLSIAESEGFDIFSPAVKTTALILVVGAWLVRRDSPIYLLSFETFKAPDSWRCDQDEIMEMMKRQKCFTQESLNFLRRILDRSGTGPATAWPPGITQCLKPDPDDPTKHLITDRSIEASRTEAQTVIFDIVEKALKKANVKPREIDVLIINCSLFSPTPSLCAMVVSQFGMRSDVETYNLSGMGCSASLISVDLAKKLLGRKGSRKALVVSTEIITPNLYHGNERGFLIQNTLFRCGGAAIVLSNNWMDGRRAWYKLLHTVRVQGSGEAAYQCVFETEDENGERGVRLSKDIVKVAGKTMEKNFTMLGPSVLPLSEQAKVVCSIALRYGLKSLGKMLGPDVAAKLPKPKPFVPDFKRGIDHFCIHAGGRAVIDGIEKNLKLEEYHTEPSRMALYNYGNTSSSSIWYELEYIHYHQRNNPLKKGDRIMQVAFGSGFKCTSGVWLKV